MEGRLQAAAVVIVAILAWSRTAEAKPTLYVAVDMSKAGVALRNNMRDALATKQLAPERFLAEQFCERFNLLGMFHFEPANGTEPIEKTIKLDVEGDWPEENAKFWITSAGVKLTKPYELFWAFGCGRDHRDTPAWCDPTDLGLVAWYQDIFSNVINDWPFGLFKNIPITTTAKLNTDGVVHMRETLEEFGSLHPMAYFEIVVSNEQPREFAVCQTMDHRTYRTIGRDQSHRKAENKLPDCKVDKLSPPLSFSGIGTVRLLRGFLQ